MLNCMDKGHGGQAVCLIIVAFLGCNRFWTLILLYMAISCQGAIYSGFLINQLDLAPNYAGTIYGITNGISSVNSCLAPLVVAALTDAQVIFIYWLLSLADHFKSISEMNIFNGILNHFHTIIIIVFNSNSIQIFKLN